MSTLLNNFREKTQRAGLVRARTYHRLPPYTNDRLEETTCPPGDFLRHVLEMPPLALARPFKRRRSTRRCHDWRVPITGIAPNAHRSRVVFCPDPLLSAGDLSKQAKVVPPW
jgi:hypothetical protein